MDTTLLKNNKQKQPSIGFAATRGSSNADRQLSFACDLITKYPQEHCCRFMPGETEARKLVIPSSPHL